MPDEKPKKKAREMTTDEALSRVFSPDAAEELKRLVRERNEPVYSR